MSRALTSEPQAVESRTTLSLSLYTACIMRRKRHDCPLHLHLPLSNQFTHHFNLILLFGQHEHDLAGLFVLHPDVRSLFEQFAHNAKMAHHRCQFPDHWPFCPRNKCSESEAKAWFTTNRAAIDAELNRTPIIMLSADDTKQTFRKLLSSMYEPQQRSSLSGYRTLGRPVRRRHAKSLACSIFEGTHYRNLIEDIWRGYFWWGMTDTKIFSQNVRKSRYN